MRNYFILTKNLIMCGLDIRTSKGGSVEMNRSLTSIISVAVILVVIVMIVKALMDLIASTIAAGGTGYQYLEQGMAAGMLAALVMGIPMVLSSFYVSNDTTTLLSLPVSLSTIAAARFTRCFFYDYSLILLFCLPAFIAFGIVTGAGALYWVIAIILFLALPAVPLVYDAVVVMVLMRLFRGIRNKKLLTTVGTVVTSVFVFVWVMLGMQTGNGDMSNGMATSLMAFGNIGGAFPNLIFANLALEQLSVVNLLLFLLSSAAFVALFIVVAKLVYFESVIGMSETATSREALSDKEAQGFGNVVAPLKAYTRVERKKLLHSPTLMQSLFSEAMWPLIMVISFIYQMNSNGDFSLENLPALASSDMAIVVLLVATAGLTYLSVSSNPIGAMQISLEGAGLSFVKSLPISFGDLVSAKVRCALPIDYAISNAIPLIFAVFLIANGMNPLVLVAVVVIGVGGNIAIKYLQIMFDLNKPNLNWSDQTALSRKSSTIFAVVAGILLGCIVALLMIIPFAFLGWGTLALMATGIIVSVAAAFGFRSAALGFAEKRLRELP